MDNNNKINNNTRPPSPKKQRNIVNPRKSKRRSPIARGRIIKLTPIDRPVTPKHVKILNYAAIEIQKVVRGWNVRKHSLLLHPRRKREYEIYRKQ